MPHINNTAELNRVINKCIAKAIDETAKIVSSKLTHYIDQDYYKQYVPKVYERTYQFLNSVSIKSIKTNMVHIYLDENKMVYKNASAKEVLNLAKHGYHGSTNISTGRSFWENYINWCNDNIVNIFINELKKQGLQI